MATIDVSLPAFFEGQRDPSAAVLESSFELDGKQQKIRLFREGIPRPAIDLDLPAILRAASQDERGFVEVPAILDGAEHRLRIYLSDPPGPSDAEAKIAVNGICIIVVNRACSG